MTIQDVQYQRSNFHLSEQAHNYGRHIHLLDDRFHQTLLAKFCEEAVVQPEANRLVTFLTQYLLTQAISSVFPAHIRQVRTRMHSSHREASFTQELLDSSPKAVVVDLMRAGILPSHLCYEILHEILPAKQIRQDHILLNRKTNDAHEVVGVQISGHKIGGSVQDAFVFIPDPMGATGSTIASVIDLYSKELPASDPKFQGVPKKFIALHFIVTPEYLKRVSDYSSVLEVFALRLDRGLSPADVLSKPLGADWSKERGLNERQYIVPGAGGIGELLNNSFD